MKCPTCPDTALVMSDRQGVEIDYCPQCRDVWLDPLHDHSPTSWIRITAAAEAITVATGSRG